VFAVTSSTDYPMSNKTITVENKETYYNFSNTEYYVSDGEMYIMF